MNKLLLILLLVFPATVFAGDEYKDIDYWRLRSLKAEAMLDGNQKKLLEVIEEAVEKIYNRLSDSCLVFKFDDRIGWDNRIGTLVITQGQYNAIIVGRKIREEKDEK